MAASLMAQVMAQHRLLAPQEVSRAPAMPVGVLHHRTRCARIQCKAAAAKLSYKAPSSSTAATELEALSRYTQLVPDTVLMQDVAQLDSLQPQAATVSAAVLAGIINSPVGNNEYTFAVQNAFSFDKCSTVTGPSKMACFFDKALVNVGSLFAKQVKGRVSTEVDISAFPHDVDKIVERARFLAQLYADMGVPASRVLLRIPATWEGIRAAAALEEQGLATHLILVYSFVQAAAAAQAGVSVIQPNVGRIRDWYRQHPGFIRDPQGPREDTGFTSTSVPAVRLVQKMYNYCQQHHPKTKVMAAGIRSKEDALALAGVDYLVLGGKVLGQLAAAPTLAGYNDGLTATGPEEDEGELEGVLTPERAAKAQFSDEELETVDARAFQAGLGRVGLDLLGQGCADLAADIARLEPMFASWATGQE